MSQEWVRDIEDMHNKFGFRDLEFTGDFLAFRIRFLEEELRELKEGIEENDPAKVVDALIDLAVVDIGTLQLGMGRYQTELVWNMVHRANMAKERRDNPTRHGAGGFDLIKPDGWQPPHYDGVKLGDFPAAVQKLYDDHIGEMGAEETNRELTPVTTSPIQARAIPTPASVRVLREAIELQIRKNEDYGSDESGIKRADYYPRGVDTIYDIVHMKMLRIRSVIEKIRSGKNQNFESVEDSIKDAINYLSFMGAYVRGELEGQSHHTDIFNRPLPQMVKDQGCDHLLGLLVDDGRAIRLSQKKPGMSLMTNNFCPDCGANLEGME